LTGRNSCRVCVRVVCFEESCVILKNKKEKKACPSIPNVISHEPGAETSFGIQGLLERRNGFFVAHNGKEI